jgi:hypothetical protein
MIMKPIKSKSKPNQKKKTIPLILHTIPKSNIRSPSPGGVPKEKKKKRTLNVINVPKKKKKRKKEKKLTFPSIPVRSISPAA